MGALSYVTSTAKEDRRSQQTPLLRRTRADDSFSYSTVVRRWPVILTNIVSTITDEIHSLKADDPKLPEGKNIISQLSGLKHAMGRNAVLE